jgi:hypothetical protein
MPSLRSTPASPWCESPLSDGESVQLEERCTIKGLASKANILMEKWERRASEADAEAVTRYGNVHDAQALAPRDGSEAETIPANINICHAHSPQSCASTQFDVDSE